MGHIDFAYWDASCARKTRFSHATHAEARICHILNSGNGLGVRALVTYKCRYCSGFHIGHKHSSHHSRGEGRRIL